MAIVDDFALAQNDPDWPFWRESAFRRRSLPKTDSDAQQRETRGGRTRRKGLAALLFGLFLLVVLGSVFFLGGFLRFTHEVSRIKAPEAPRADAIVAFTGGAERIDEAIRLLKEGYARHLLISGVHPSTSRGVLERRIDAAAALFDCCIELDHRALDTVGNAVETGKWVRDRKVVSLIVVTSNYHMPRSLMELANALPETELIPFPVRVEKVAVDRWWQHPGTAGLLFREYLKYLVATIRIGLDSGPSARLATASANHRL